jgi:hypothetical protein
MADTDTRQPQHRRGPRGRFAKGQSGNPAGRPAGILNEATRIMATMLSGEIEQLGRTVIDLARIGKPVPLKLAMEPILAPLKRRPVAFALPSVRGPDDLPDACAAISEAAGTGLITPEEAAALAQMLEAQARTLAIGDRLRADRLVEQKEEVGLRFDLGAAVVIAARVCEIRLEAQKVDKDIAALCLPLESLGDDALSALRAIPYTREMLDADRVFLGRYPLQPERLRHEIIPAMGELLPSLLDYLDRDGDRIDRELDRHYETLN